MIRKLRLNLRLKYKVLGGSIALLAIIMLASGASIISIERMSSSVRGLVEISAESRLSDALVAQVKDTSAKVKDYAQTSDEGVAALIKTDFQTLSSHFEALVAVEKTMAYKDDLAAIEQYIKSYQEDFQNLYDVLQKRKTLLENGVLLKARQVSESLSIISEQTQLSGDTSSALSAAAVRGHFLSALINLNAYLRTHGAELKLEYTNALANFKEEADLLELYLSADNLLKILSEVHKTVESIKANFDESEKMFIEASQIVKGLEQTALSATQKVNGLNNGLQLQQQTYQQNVEKDFVTFGVFAWALLFIGIGLALVISWYITASTNGIIQRLSDTFNHMFETIKSVGKHASSVANSSILVERVSQGVQDKSKTIANNTDRLASSVTEVSAAVEEMDYSITEIAESVQESVSLIRQASGYANAASDVIKKLEVASSQINDVISLINGLAEQTNLLALNASIEAARAGDAGRGFAVVADEVKKLAAQTSDATDTISNQVESMQGISGEVVTSITQILGSINSIQSNAQGISKTIEEQKKASSVVSGNMHSISESTGSVNDEVGGILEDMVQNGEAASNLSFAAQEMNTKSTDMQKDASSFLHDLKNI